MIGYALLGKKWYEVLAGFIKASVGYMILSVGSSGLINVFRPVIVGLKGRFNLSAMVIDPYFGNNAVDAGVKAAQAGDFSLANVSFLKGANISQYMLLLLFAYSNHSLFHIHSLSERGCGLYCIQEVISSAL